VRSGHSKQARSDEKNFDDSHEADSH
jgi:hypothetical protein